MRTSSPADIPLSTVVTYGSYDFSATPTNQPVPFVTMEQQMLNDHNGRWGRKDNVSINGVITGDFNTIKAAQINIVSGFAKDFQTFLIKDTGVWAEHPAGAASGSLTDQQLVYEGKNCIVRSISFDEGRYFGMLNYSINLEAYNDSYTPTSGVLDPVDQYSFSEDQDEETITITHNVSARGIVSGAADPLAKAIAFVHSRSGYKSGLLQPEFITTGAAFCPVLKTQSETIDRPSAMYSITETYEAEATGCSNCITKYSCSLDSGIRDDFVRASINGEVNCGKTGTMAQARTHFATLDLHGLLVAEVDPNNSIDIHEIPLSFNTQETYHDDDGDSCPVGVEKGNKRISFSASYDNNNIYDGISENFVYKSSGAYFEYNVNVSYDEISEVASASMQGTIQSRGNLNEKVTNVNDFITTELCRSGTDHQGTGLLRTLANTVYTELTGSDFLNIKGHPLNSYPNSLSIISGRNNGTASVSATYDNSDRIEAPEIRESSYNINVKTGMEIFKPRASVNEDGVYGIYKTKVYGREEVALNASVVADHRSSGMTKNTVIEGSGEALISSLRTAFVTGSEVRLERENVNRAEANGSLSLSYTFSDNTTGIIPSGSVYKQVGE